MSVKPCIIGLALAALGLLCVPAQVFAQHSGFFRHGLAHEVNRYRWDADVDFQDRFGQWDLRFSNKFRTDGFVLFDNVLSFRDENNTRATVRRKLGTRLWGKSAISAEWFSLGRVLIQESLVGLSVVGNDGWMFEPMVGFAVDQRPGASSGGTNAPLRFDSGPSASLLVSYLQPQADDGSSLSVRSGAAVRNISPRRGQELFATVRGVRTFGPATYISDLFYSNYRRDAYEPVSFLNRDAGALAETIESTTSDTLGLSLAATGNLTNTLTLVGNASFIANNRSIRNTGDGPADVLFFATDFKRRSFESQVTLTDDRRWAKTYITVSFAAEQEDRTLANRSDLPAIQANQRINQLRQADYDRGNFGLAGGTTLRLSRALVTTSLSASILRHNTPDENPDDRDESLIIARIGTRIPVVENVVADINLFGSRYKTVYLKSLRSAENNTQRSLRLRPVVEWTPSARTDIRFGSEVRATYTEDFFVLPGRRPRDQSARELRHDLRIAHRLNNSMEAVGHTSYSALHLGRFLGDRFAEIPLDTLNTVTGRFTLTVGKKLQSKVGMRGLNRSDYSPALTQRYPDPSGSSGELTITRPGRETIMQIGPTAGFSWSNTGRSLLTLDGWLAFQHVSRKLYGLATEPDVRIIEREASRGTRKTIPNVTISMTWFF